MQVQRWTSWQTMVQGFLALWLGLVVPLLCVPGLSSNHTHGLHWVWDAMESTEEPITTHEHHHSHGDSDGHGHSEEPVDTAPALPVPVGIPTIRSNQTPQVEQLMNVFGIMGTVPTGLPLTAVAGLVLLVSGRGLFCAVPPLALPWNPPKTLS
jgi:hypothetical protein